MKEIFCLKQQNDHTRKQNLVYPIPHTVSYGIQQAEDVSSFKINVVTQCKNICNCNLCKAYIVNLGYIDNNTTLKPQKCTKHLEIKF